MKTESLEAFQKMRSTVEELRESVSKFTEETINPTLGSKKGFSPALQQDVDILMERVAALEASFSGLRKMIEDMDREEPTVYEVASLANKIEYALKDWQSRFTGLKSVWESVLEGLEGSPQTKTIPVTDGRELVQFMIEQSSKIDQILQKASFKLQIYRKLEPPIKKIVDELDGLKTRLEKLGEEWQPEGQKVEGHVDALLTQAGQLAEQLGLVSSNGDESSDDDASESLPNDVEITVPQLLERQRELQEFFARSQLFDKIRPSLGESISQLNQLCDCLKGALVEWKPKNEEIRDVYNSMLDKYRTTKSIETGVTSVSSERFERLNSAFEKFRIDWESKTESILGTLNDWSGGV